MAIRRYPIILLAAAACACQGGGEDKGRSEQVPEVQQVQPAAAGLRPRGEVRVQVDHGDNRRAAQQVELHDVPAPGFRFHAFQYGPRRRPGHHGYQSSRSIASSVSSSRSNSIGLGKK